MHVERMATGLAAGAAGALPVGGLRLPGGVPLRARRRRREKLGQELATPLAASFLGLLMVQTLQPAQAAAGLSLPEVRPTRRPILGSGVADALRGAWDRVFAAGPWACRAGGRGCRGWHGRPGCGRPVHGRGEPRVGFALPAVRLRHASAGARPRHGGAGGLGGPAVDHDAGDGAADVRQRDGGDDGRRRGSGADRHVHAR